MTASTRPVAAAAGLLVLGAAAAVASRRGRARLSALAPRRLAGRVSGVPGRLTGRRKGAPGLETWTCQCGQRFRVAGTGRHRVHWLEDAPESDPVLGSACPSCERPLPTG